MCRMHSRGGDGCTARRRPGSRSSACLGRKEKRRGAWGAPGARVPERRGNLFAQLSSPSRCALWWRQRLARAAPRPALYYLPGISCGPLVHRGGGLVRAASQQAGPEPGHCRGRGRTLLPAPCVCWGSWAIVCVPVSASLSVVEGPYGAEHERWHCVLCRMFGSQFVQKTTMLWGDDKKKVVKKGNEWVSRASWGAQQSESTNSRQRAALPRCCTCLRFDGWGVWAELEICLAVLQEDAHLPPVSGAAGSRALTACVGRLLGILGRARNLLGSRARRPTRATSKRTYRADKDCCRAGDKHAGAAGSLTGGL